MMVHSHVLDRKQLFLPGAQNNTTRLFLWNSAINYTRLIKPKTEDRINISSNPHLVMQRLMYLCPFHIKKQLLHTRKPNNASLSWDPIAITKRINSFLKRFYFFCYWRLTHCIRLEKGITNHCQQSAYRR